MTVVLQTLNGLTIGAIYILLASGLTIVFGLQGIVNVAHGVFYMLGAYLAIGLYPRIGFAATVAAVFALTALLGLVLELAGVRPSSDGSGRHAGARPDPRGRHHRERGDEARLGPGTAAIRRPRGPGRHPDPRTDRVSDVLALRDRVHGGADDLLALAFHRTTLGILVQSIALNSEISQAMGTNAPRINSLVFALGTGVAGVAGVLAGPILSVYPTMCFDLLMILFVVVILGGLGSLLGIVVSGVLIGLVNAFGVAYLSGTAGNILAFAVMIAVLIFRPLGLFGRAGILK